MKTAVVTGANSGIGLETTKGLAERGFRVIMGCRSRGRGEDARDTILKDLPEADLQVLPVDLSRKASIEAFADNVPGPIDVLVNNAGLWNPKRRENPEGLELTFAVNHLGPFRLTHALMPKIKKDGGRIVTVASTAHHFAGPDWDDLQMERKYDGNRQYGNSKLYNIWFSDELARRIDGTGITANCLHPGSGITGLTRDFPNWVDPLLRHFLKSPRRLAYTSIRVATDPDLEGKSGGYYHLDRRAHKTRLAKDESSAKRLWEITEGLA